MTGEEVLAVHALADALDREAAAYRAAEPVHWRALADATEEHAARVRALAPRTDPPATDDLIARLRRAHAMSVSDAADPTRRTLYGDAADALARQAADR